MTVKLEDQSLSYIPLYVDNSYVFKVDLTKKCSSVTYLRTEWEALTLGRKFWTNGPGDDQKIIISKENVNSLPRNTDIPMRITQYYQIGVTEYIATYDFTFILAGESLVAFLEYDAAVNIKSDDSFYIDARNSYDLAEEG